MSKEDYSKYVGCIFVHRNAVGGTYYEKVLSVEYNEYGAYYFNVVYVNNDNGRAQISNNCVSMILDGYDYSKQEQCTEEEFQKALTDAFSDICCDCILVKRTKQ